MSPGLDTNFVQEKNCCGKMFSFFIKIELQLRPTVTSAIYGKSEGAKSMKFEWLQLVKTTNNRDYLVCKYSIVSVGSCWFKTC